MRGFVALLSWEWRSHRAIAAVMALAILGLSLAFRSMAPDARYWNMVALATVPSMWALFMTGLSADVMGSDLASRRIESLALLPAGLPRIWASKAAFVLAALVASLVWTLGCQFVTVLAFDFRDAGGLDFLRFLAFAAGAAAFSLPLVALAMLAATLVERPLPALFLALAAGAAVFAGTIALLAWIDRDTMRSAWIVPLVWVGFGTTFTVAAARTFVAGRVHAGPGWRRWAVAGSSVGILLLCVAGVAGWRVWSWKQMAAGDADVRITSIHPSPDGRWLALCASKCPSERGEVTACRVWTLALDADRSASDGLVECARDRSCGLQPWNADGTLRIYGREGAQSLRQDVDPATACVRASKRFNLYEDGDPDLRGTWFPWWAKFEGATSWENGKPFTRTVLWPERAERRRFTSVRALTLSRRPGIVWSSPDGRRVVRHDLATGEDRDLCASEGPIQGCWASKDGNRLLVTSERRAVVRDADTGTLLAGPWTSRWASWTPGDEHGRLVHLWDDATDQVAVADRGRVLDVGSPAATEWFTSSDVADLPDGRLVALRRDGAVDLLTADGAPIRRLYPPKGN